MSSPINALAYALMPFFTAHRLPQVALCAALKDMIFAFGHDEDSWFEKSCELDLSNEEFDARCEQSLKDADLALRAVCDGKLFDHYERLKEKARKYDSLVSAIAPAVAAPKCDGNHGGPRCADPDCWNDSPDAFESNATA